MTGSYMDALFSNQDTIAVAGAFLTAIIAILALAWRRVEKDRADAELKRTMLDRGMSAEEIERVINAGARQGESLSLHLAGQT